MAHTPRKSVLHIKRHTRGTSNELSLDVLEAKSDAVVSESSSPKTVKPAAPPSSGAASLAQTDPDAEIRRRKSRRHRSRITNIVAVAAVLVVIAVVAGTYITSLLNHRQQQESILNDAISLIGQSDDAVVSMDASLSSPLTSQTLDDVKGIQSKLSGTGVLLDRALNKVLEAEEVQNGGKEELVQRAKDDIEARKDMVEQGKVLLAADVSAKQAADDLTDAWDQVLQADALASEAAKLVSSTNQADIQTALGKDQQALAGFQKAQTQLAQVKREFPSANLDTFGEYVEKRISGMQSAIACDQAVLVQDKATAESNNADANTAAREAAAIATRLPDNPAQPVLDAYTSANEGARASYAQARSTAAEADSYLRDYLGEEGK